MKMNLHLTLVAAAAALFGGCSSANSESASRASEEGASGGCCAPSPAAAEPAAAASAAMDAYPLSTCVISGEKLGGMGDFVTVSCEGVDVRLCCPGCKKEFNKDPRKYAAMVTAARK